MNSEQLGVRQLLNQWVIDALINIKDHKIKRIDARRIPPLLVILIIVSVTITHEATYAGSFETNGFQFIGWPYAIAINLAIIIGEYFIQWKSSRIAAWATFIIATLGSGALNIAYIKPWEYSGFDAVFASIYSLLPTIIIVCLGLLSSRVGKIAKTQEARWERESDNEDQYECFCGEKFSKPIQLANHTKKHITELKQQPNIINGVNALVYFKQTYPNATYYPDMKKLNGWTDKINEQKDK